MSIGLTHRFLSRNAFIDLSKSTIQAKSKAHNRNTFIGVKYETKKRNKCEEASTAIMLMQFFDDVTIN